VVAGVQAGVGASTLAAALHARDAGIVVDGADVLVSGADAASLTTLGAVVGRVVGTPGRRPLLAVVSDAAEPPVRLPGGLGPVTVLPHLPAPVAMPPARMAALLSWPAQRLSPELCAYAGAVRVLAATLVTGGFLAEDAEPVRAAPVYPARRLWRGLGPVERWDASGQPRVTPTGIPDDDALEAAQWQAGG